MRAIGVTLADLDLDPYPVYARLRREEPVSWLPEVRQWLVTTWADVSRVLADPELFTSDIPGSPMIRFCGGQPMITREGPAHLDIREAMINDYDPHRVIDRVDTIIRPCAERLVERLSTAGTADLAGEYFEPVALLSHATLQGLDIADAARLRRWGMALVDGLTNVEASPDKEAEAVAAMSDMDNVLKPVIARLRERPDNSVLAHLIHSGRPARAGRPDEDLLPELKQHTQAQIAAGWAGGWTLAALLHHPDQLDEIRSNRWLVGAAVYEALRWNSVIGAVTRRATRAMTLGGKDIPEGSLLAVSIASANRDETVFDHPDQFDIHRTVRTHLAFGTGTHHCPAYAFMPAIARTALDVLLDHLPHLRPAPDRHPKPHGWKLRLPGPVHATWSNP